MMLTNFFGKSKPINFILITALFTVYFIVFFVKFNFDIVQGSLLLLGIKSWLLTLVMFFVFNVFIYRDKLTRDNSYAFLVFTISLCCIPFLVVDLTMLLEHSILLLLFEKIYRIRNQKNIYAKLFDSGIILSVLFIMNPTTICYVVLIYAAVLLFAKLHLRTLLIPVLGFITPLILYFTYTFFYNKLDQFFSLFEFSNDLSFTFLKDTYFVVTFSLVLLLTFTAILLNSANIFSTNSKFKKRWILLLIHLVVAFFYVLTTTTTTNVEILSIFIPTSIIIANWLQIITQKKRVDVLLYSFLLYSFIMLIII